MVIAKLQKMSSTSLAMANFCEIDESGQIFNVNYVFNQTTVLAKYIKSHVWFKNVFDQPSIPDKVSFGAFGQKFGMFMCYDILFSSPSRDLIKDGISLFAYNAQIPILGRSVFSVWSWKNNATLIAGNPGKNNGGIFVKGKQITKEMAGLLVADL